MRGRLVLFVVAGIGLLSACGGSAPAVAQDLGTPTPLAFAETTDAPSAAPSVAAIPKASPTKPPSGKLTVTLDPIAAVAPGDDASATAHTLPGATCSIAVSLKSGPSKAKGLGQTEADADGTASWYWTVGMNTSKGSWPVTVTCKSGSASASAKTKLVVG